MSDTIVETTAGVDDIVYHPSGGTAAGNQLDVVAVESPVVPKVFQGTDEVRRTGVKPWQFVKEDNLHFHICLFLLKPVAKFKKCEITTTF